MTAMDDDLIGRVELAQPILGDYRAVKDGDLRELLALAQSALSRQSGGWDEAAVERGAVAMFRAQIITTQDWPDVPEDIKDDIRLRVRAALIAAGAPPSAPTASESRDNACLTSLAEQVPCRPDPNNLKRCTICGFVVDTAYSAEPPAKERRPR